MSLRCLLFSSDEGTAHTIRKVLTDLGIEGEYCPVAVGAVERVTHQSFQLVIVDWDNQPEAGFLLQTARERKAAERPLTLAIVKDDASVPQALQAGANSILRKPILPNQVKDTLTTARDLLRAKFQSSSPTPQAAAASVAAGAKPAAVPHEIKQTLRSEFRQSGSPAPRAQFVTETQKSFDQPAATESGPVEDLEPMAATVEKEEAPIAPPRRHEEPRGLSFYLNARAGTLPPNSQPTSAPAPAKPELLGYESAPSRLENSPVSLADPLDAPAPTKSPAKRDQRDKKTEAELFAYIAGESKLNPEKTPAKPRPWLRKAALLVALAATCGVAYVKVPPSLWHQNLRMLVAYVTHVSHGLLNPQTPAPQQAPVAHENFGRAGDEYKLPVAENIPDATTDPSQIKVLPVIDPTAKPPKGGAANADQPPADTNPATTEQPTPSPVQVQENQPPQSVPAPSASTEDQPQSAPTRPPTSTISTESPRPDPFVAAPATFPTAVVVRPSPPKKTQPTYTSATSNPGIPSSLKSQMASITPEASGNKPPEAAMPSIEPVNLPESTARALLTQQPDPVYPETAKGKQGSVVLQVLIGRDGTVQDAKFLQGSLAFARVAIDAVKQWRFKPYTMNGRPVSTQTLLTLNFKPTS